MIEDYEVRINEKFDDKCLDIFNQQTFINLHKTSFKSIYTFSLICISKSKVISALSVSENSEQIFVSPVRGTYGGIEYIGNVSFDLTNFFLEYVEKFLSDKGGKNIIITMKPFAHNPSQSAIFSNIFYNRSYSILKQELNSAINVDGIPLIDKMNYNNKKRLRKCEREGFEFVQFSENESIEEIYEIIKVNRANKGIQISMSLEQIKNMLEVYPENIYFFGVKDKTKLVASSICIKINNNVLYVFYWGDALNYEQFSPITLIAKGIYIFAQENKYSILDVGISTVNSVPNIGLIKFKQNLGFTESLRLTYSKILN